jgi:hypothetical protein
METCKPSDHVPVELTLQLPVQTSQSNLKRFTTSNPPTIPLASKNITSYSESDSESSGLRLHSLSGLVQTAISFDSTSKAHIHKKIPTTVPNAEAKLVPQQEDSKK